VYSLLFLFLFGAIAAEGADPTIEALQSEITRAMDSLAGMEAEPYFIAIEVTERDRLFLSAEDGALHGYAPTKTRVVDVDVRIGSPQLDSSHALRSQNERPKTLGRRLPLTDDVAVLRRDIWRELDARLLDARERWAQVQSDRAVLVQESPGLDLAPLNTHPTDLLDLPVLTIDPKEWEDPLRRISAILAQDEIVRDGSIQLNATTNNSWFTSSEGTAVRHGRVEYSILANVDTIADDGTVLRLSKRWATRSADSLPSEQTLTEGVSDLHALLSALRSAPEQAPYSGPVVLSDRAAGVFFHEIFGHRMEGQRLKRVDNAQTFTDKIGQQVLPPFLSVVDDPTAATLDDTDLRGHYRYDNEGVPAQAVSLVEKGVLKGFLQSRSTVGPQDESNGHGRRATGRMPVTRQGNLIVTASQSLTNSDLRTRLLTAAKDAGLPYALWIDDIQGGFTFTNRGMPNAFNVNVLVAHRVWVDGRPDELVRGIDLIGTPLIAFSRIAAAGERVDVFNGNCGAESGWVPVSAAAPALLVTQLETQRKTKGQNTPPLLPPPGIDGAAVLP
jgi:TldD protein